MAIWHFRADMIGKSAGKSVVAAAAYRAGVSLQSDCLGLQFDYSRKVGVACSEILLPANAPSWMADRQLLWNAVEKIEKRKDATLAREIKAALPYELSLEQNKMLLREYLQDQFIAKGMIADYAIHDIDSHNPHVHILLTLRHINENGFGLKVREWNDKGLFEIWREQWAEVTNRHLALNGFSQRIDHRSYAEQGIELEPTLHRGPRLEHNDKSENLDRAQKAREVQQRNLSRLLADPSIAIDLLSHHESVFNHQDLSKFVHYRTSSVEEFNQLKLAIESCNELVNLGKGADGKQYYTSKTVLKREQVLLETAKELSQSQRHQQKATRFEAIARNLSLNPEQKEAFDFILSGHDLSLLVGFAGTGKGYLMNAVREAYESQGYQVRGVALAGKAADGLAQSAHISAKTIARTLLDWENQRDTLNHKTVLIVDEAGMIGTRQLQLLLTEAERTKAKIILCGDPEQIPSIEAGSPFRYLLERMPHKFLKTIVRQKLEWQREATLQLSTQQHPRALDQYQSHQHIHKEETRIQALDTLVKDWFDYHKANPEKEAIMMAYRNSDVAVLNQLARNYLKEDKRLSQESLIKRVNRGEIYLAEGERLLFLRNENSLSVKNGQLATISKLKRHIITVEMDRGDTLSFDTRDYYDFTYGYAATVHKLQGAT
ncbi:MAG TPA: Ti-type conjugative transfer relaxase TraA, partial [Coxiellaceae bacterium]|nr:Ti-type conjugative transfer relaxase TraA [Coxiellaceae bacterium]